MSASRTVKCPQCGAMVPWTPVSTWRPFCSERCRTLDLGAWAAEAYRIPAAAPADRDEGVGDDDAPGRER